MTRTGRSAAWMLLMVVCALLPGMAIARPAITVDLGSKTAWTFRPDDANTPAKTLPVPTGGWRLNGFPDATAGTYERRITIPKLPNGGPQVTQIAFEAVNWEATISVGPDAEHLQEAGKHLSAWTPFRVDISRFVTPGQTALLRVYVRDRTHFTDAQGRFTIPAATEWNDRQARGIIRSIVLQVQPATYIDDVFVKPDTSSRTLSYDVALVNASSQPRRVTLKGALTPANAGAKWPYPSLPTTTLTLSAGQTKQLHLGPIRWTPGPASWWWPNVPYQPNYRARLHTLTLTLTTGEGTGAQQSVELVRFGFCTPGQKGNQYTLNGIRINLRGDSLPEGTIGTDAFARLPGFLPPTSGNPGWPGAVRNYQRLNFNVIRMHQVPCTRYMMDVCDELGMLVIPETAIRGAGGQKQNITVQPEAFTTHLRELILRDRNHPSVFKWSLENELFGAPEAFVQQLAETCTRADGTRPYSIDDNADYPNLPRLAVIEHYSQPPGTPDATGGHPRADRPFGQGEYVWPMGNSYSGPLWFSMMTRALRAHDNADIRPYTLLDVWPGVIPGLHSTNFPDPPLPPNSLEQGGRSLLDPVVPWQMPAIQLLQRSFAPVALYDPAYDRTNTTSNGHGDWPAIQPALPAGKRVKRELLVFNDEFAGDTLEARIRLAFDAKEGETQPLLPIARTLHIPPGGHAVVPVEFTVPTSKRNGLLTLTLSLWKNGRERYHEDNYFVTVPEGIGGTQVVYEGRDDSTHGDWGGKYGREAFSIPVRLGKSAFEVPGIRVYRGSYRAAPGVDENAPLPNREEEQSNLLYFSKEQTTTDTRVAAIGPGVKDRSPAAFMVENEPLFMRIDTADGKPHRLSLYLLDYKREEQEVDVDLFDTQGHRQDTRKVTKFGEGAYLTYRFVGSVVVRIMPITQGNPTLSGVFVDPASGDGLLWH